MAVPPTPADIEVYEPDNTTPAPIADRQAAAPLTAVADPVLQVRDLRKVYPEVVAVDGVSFAIGRGRCLGLLGPNGAGKTTTVEMIEGIVRPTSGVLLYEGEPLGARFRQEVGIQFQHTALQDFLTVGETLALFHRLYERRAPLDQVIARCQLQAFLDRDNRRLSGGQRQRLLLAIALVNDPHILFLDEPTTGLDPQARRAFWELIEGIKAQGKTVVLTTHYMEEAYRLCDQIAIMDHGRIIAEGPPVDLLDSHFGDLIFELPEGDLPATLRNHPADFPGQLLFANGKVELFARDVEATIDLLRQWQVPLSNLRIRQRTLEDLFLHLTGKALRP